MVGTHRYKRCRVYRVVILSSVAGLIFFFNSWGIKHGSCGSLFQRQGVNQRDKVFAPLHVRVSVW